MKFNKNMVIGRSLKMPFSGKWDIPFEKFLQTSKYNRFFFSVYGEKKSFYELRFDRYLSFRFCDEGIGYDLIKQLSNCQYENDPTCPLPNTVFEYRLSPYVFENSIDLNDLKENYQIQLVCRDSWIDCMSRKTEIWIHHQVDDLNDVIKKYIDEEVL